MAKRILVRNHGPVEANVRQAFAAVLAEAKANGEKTVLLIVPSKSTFSGNVVSTALGESVTKELLKGGPVEVQHGISFKLESPHTLKHSNTVRVALAAYLGARDLRAVDGLSNLRSIVFLPWLSDEEEGWQQSWNDLPPICWTKS